MIFGGIPFGNRESIFNHEGKRLALDLYYTDVPRIHGFPLRKPSIHRLVFRLEGNGDHRNAERGNPAFNSRPRLMIRAAIEKKNYER